MLLLFDIDGTLLIRATDAHAEALHAAIHEVDHVEVPDASVPTAGRTDLAIMRSLLTLAGVDAKKIDDGVQARCDAACFAYARLCPDDLSACVAPDVPDVLERLAAAGHVIGLVTGNLEPIARLKLRRAGLGAWFANGAGGFGSDHEDRSELPALARRRAAELLHGPGTAPLGRTHTVVIGDTALDVACAHADGVRCVGITTGPHRAIELIDADVVIDGMDELEGVLAEWAGA
ncbi:MAG: family hydrolase [Solirubrobacterales bacterium]|nr:family hydrolase [Solirubrobacterales bacterium]